ncbi:MAG TPA: septal ring lytic transglycosylase RlpA family protein [Pseudolabrys sp.]|nr:septal ring lytic transglycosylase RlpA family protein [Pseudolabrys sp.]
MRGVGGSHARRRCAGFIGLVVLGLLLANCSGNVAGRIDPRYGVASSARVVQPGEPVPKGGGVYRVGRPYTVAGRVYTPEENAQYSESGLASWYGDDFHGRYTANGEIFDMNSISAASPTLPLPSYARVTNLDNHRSIVVRVNDRGPYVGNRLIDVSVRTAKLLGFYGKGVTKVKVEYIGRAPLAGSDDEKLAATLREPGKSAPVQVASAENFAPAYFDPHPLTRAMPRQAPMPPERPYALGDDTAEAPPPPDVAAAPPPPAKAIPVSAYAPVRYDGGAGMMSGRGLY